MLGDFIYHIPFNSNYYPIFSSIAGVLYIIYEFIEETKKANFKLNKFSIFIFFFILSSFVTPHIYYYHLWVNDRLIWSFWILAQDIGVLIAFYFVINSLDFIDDDWFLRFPELLLIYCIVFYFSFISLFVLNSMLEGYIIEIILGIFSLVFFVFNLKVMMSKNQQYFEEKEV